MWRAPVHYVGDDVAASTGTLCPTPSWAGAETFIQLYAPAAPVVHPVMHIVGDLQLARLSLLSLLIVIETHECATFCLVPTLILTLIAAIPHGLALRADFEILSFAHHLAPVVAAPLSPLQHFFTHRINEFKQGIWLMTSLQQKMYNVVQDSLGDVVTLKHPIPRGDLGCRHIPKLAGVGTVHVLGTDR